MFSLSRRTGILLTLLFTEIILQSCTNSQGGAGGFTIPPTPVETIVIQPQTVYDRFEAVGTVEADNAVTIVSEIDAVVRLIPFHEGDFIKKGGLIALLDTSQLAAEYHRTQALMAQSRASYLRIKSVVDQGAGSAQDLDDAAAALRVAKANMALAKARFDKTIITAPFSGTIGARKVSPGAFLRSGQAITELAQLDLLRINFAAPERYLGKLTSGAEVNVSTTAYPDYTVKGKIKVIDPVVDPITRSARVIAVVSNPGNRFRPGMSANVSAVLSERANALTVPNEAVFVSGNQPFVYVVKADSSVAKAALTLGTRLADVVEVVQGLQPGNTIVTAGHQKIYDGARVLPITNQSSPIGQQSMESAQ